MGLRPILLSVITLLSFSVVPTVSSAPTPEYTPGSAAQIASIKGVEKVIASIHQTSTGLEVKRIPVESDQTATKLADKEKAKPGVLAVSIEQKEQLISSYYTSNDPEVSKQWYLTDPLRMQPVHSAPYRGDGVTIAVIDTGVDYNHPDLQGKVINGPNYTDPSCTVSCSPLDDNKHGTQVAGIIASTLDNGIGTVGIAPNSRILAIKALDYTGSGYNSDISEGIIYAADHGADIINLSLGSLTDNAVMQHAVEYAQSKNVLVVAAAGNIEDGYNDTRWPAAYPGVVAVGATTVANNSASFSVKKDYLSVVAPGSMIYSPSLYNSYEYASGTSAAAPAVAALAALVKQKHPYFSADNIKTIMEARATDLGAPGKDIYYGYGLINPINTLDIVVPPSNPTNPSPPPITITPVAKGAYTVTSQGIVRTYAGAQWYGDLEGSPLNKPIVGMAVTKSGQGYTLVASDGGVFTFGDAKFYGSMGGKPLNKPIVGLTTTSSGNGYWLVASDGGIFSYGDAQFHGSMGGKPLNKPMVGISRSPSGSGYWTVASDGGIFSFGTGFHGSMGGKPLNKPMIGIMATPSGKGYYTVASDGGIFAFGDAKFLNSRISNITPTVGISITPTGNGYITFQSSGTIETFGDAFQYAPTVGWYWNDLTIGGSLVSQ